MEYNKLDPIQKELWLKNLRSGEYKQIKENLRSDDGYCCLGVGYYICKIDVSPLGAYRQLCRMNDGKGEYGGNPQSFIQIADWIEKNL